MRSIKVKLVLAVSLLIIFLFGTGGFLLVSEKEKELANDIYLRTRSFSEMSVASILDDYEKYLQEGAFVLFNREMEDTFRKNEDVAEVMITNYTGEIFYNSVEERQRQYEGEKRTVQDQEFLDRVQAANRSFKLSTGRVVYLRKDEEGNFRYLDGQGNDVSEIRDTERIENIVFPYRGEYVVVYTMTYKFLNERVAKTRERIILLTVFGILVGLAGFYLLATRMTKPLKKLKEGVLNIATGNFEARVFVKTKDEIGVLAEAVNKMAEDLEQSTKALVYRERVAKELELAAKIQQDLLPKKIPQVSGLEIAAGLIPAVEIGGDCFDFLQPDKENTLIYVGDVTGHGVPSGLVVAIANAIVFSLSRGSRGIRDILIDANTILKSKTSPNMFLTMLLLNWNSAANKLTYVNAGHEKLIYYQAAEKKVSLLLGGGIAIGMMPDVSKLLKEFEVKMVPGDVLLLYTDGITEAKSPKGEFYGLKRLADVFEAQAAAGNVETIKKGIIDDVKKFIGEAEQEDDITLVVVRRS